MQRRTSLALFALLVAGATPFAYAGPQSSGGKVSVMIAPGEVTIDGSARPDLGRSFADTIAGGLLETGSYSIIDPDVSGAIAGTGDKPPTAEEIIAAERGASAQYAFVPRLIVEGDFNRLTLKKIRVTNGEVVDIYSKTTTNVNRSAMFDLLDETMELVYADIANDKARIAEADTVREIPALDPAPVHRSTAAMDLTPPPTPVAPELDPEPVRRKGRGVIEDQPRMASPRPAPKKRKGRGVIEDEPPAPKITKKPEDKPEEIDTPEAEEATEVAEYAGRLRAVNTDWDFCIIEVAKRGSLRVNDELLVRSSTSLEPLGKLRVSKVEGSQVVADALDVPLEMLRAGFKVYRWVKK
jgi:hypothetical protein